ncbi:MAG TPA: DinB family protein [Pyrinomonadaceae bacterium]|jgi:hypothetical protein|nr:DinB family protein [Pyrinomonadaceae bacterium]
MIYQNVADIFAANDAIRSRLSARAAELNEAQQNFRPTADAWSPAEIVEHLALIEGRLTKLFSMMLHKLESAATEAGATARPMQPFSLDEFAGQARQRFNAPEEVRPSGGVKLADALAQLQASRAALNALRPRVEAVDGATATYQHPAFGALNLYQWLAFIGAHEERHLRQLERLLAQMDGAADGTGAAA